ncbi:MAG TPA: beta-galactosidase trimerization domain-containing protein [Jiangellaceae bacterium]
MWTELTHVAGAEVVATYKDGPLPGRAAITRRPVGDGAAWYVATRLDEAATAVLADRIADAAGVTRRAETSQEVEIVRRTGATASYLFIINHGSTRAAVSASGVDLLTGSRHGPVATIPAGGVVVLREEHDHRG